MTNKEVEEFADAIQTLVAGGKTVEGACQQLVKLSGSQALVDAARVKYEKSVGLIGKLKEPVTVVGKKSVNWYGGPGANDRYWNEFQKNIKASLPPDVVDHAFADLNDASSKIIDLAGAPGWIEIRSKGLVLGYVQSGKTTNFMGVMAKAADAGYRLFIVLSGMTDNLRSQTQSRIEEVLVGAYPERWYLLTSLDEDFSHSQNAAKLLNDPQQRMIAVVKKNGHRLRRLKNWIATAGNEIGQKIPIMLIDDEADQGSLDVGKAGKISQINGLIGQIIDRKRSAYVAYTATPFANLLTDPKRYENLYPDDYIVEMKRPDGYFGAERLFGRDALPGEDDSEAGYDGLDVIRSIDEDEAMAARPPSGKGGVQGWQPEIGDALDVALRWFLVGTAARRARSGTIAHSTMLVHTSMRADAHNALAGPVSDHLKSLATRFESDPSLTVELRALWETESEAVPASAMGLQPLTWGEVAAALPDVLQRAKVIIDNYTSTDRLTYSKKDPATVVVIGGNTLSRGLTLEGLMSSYFVRSASAYDTLLQMGRWFGYRRGYEDLARVWMPDELAEWFLDLATVEEEIRRDIRNMPAGSTPRDVGVRIRTHPSMAITAAAKMRGAVDASISYSMKREQTIIFNHLDADWLRQNIEATRDFLKAALKHGATNDSASGRYLLKNVPCSLVLDFLNSYRMHPNAHRLRSDLVRHYISQQNDHGALQLWNVALVENKKRPPAADLDLGIGRSIHTIERSRLKNIDGHANLKAIVSTIDRIADCGTAAGELPSDIDPRKDEDLARFRQDVIGDKGLLVLYPIDKDSKAQPKVLKEGKKAPRDPRTDLGAVDHLIGVGIFFPAAVGQPDVDYKTANLAPVIEDDSEEFDAAEQADVASEDVKGPA